MKDSKQWLQNMFLGLIAVVVGIVIFFQKEEPSKLMVIGIGIFVFVTGTIALFFALKKSIPDLTRNLLLVRGILGVVAGIISILLPLADIGVGWELMRTILGVVLAAGSLLILFSLTGLKKAGIQISGTLATLGISIVLALIIFLTANVSGKLIISLIAAALVIYGIILIFIGFQKRKGVARMKQQGDSLAGKEPLTADADEMPPSKKKGRKPARGAGNAPEEEPKQPVPDEDTDPDIPSPEKSDT